MPCAHAPYATDGSCANYDWGPARDTAADWRESTTYSPRGYGYRNCTDYVAWRIQQETGRDISGLGNATDWDTTAPRLGLRVLASGQMPAAGDIAQFEGTRSASPGHVAFVEAVHADGSVKVAEYNHDGQGHFDERDNVRADHYIDVNGTSNDHSDTEAGGPSGGMAYAAVSDGQSLYTDEGWAYKKIGGAAFLIGGATVWTRANGACPRARYQCQKCTIMRPVTAHRTLVRLATILPYIWMAGHSSGRSFMAGRTQ
jgi:surface antigen